MCMYAPYGPFFASLTEMLPSNVIAGAIALVNGFGALGSFIGSYLVGYLNGSTGGFSASYMAMSVSVFLSAVLAFMIIKDPHSTNL
jgi:sugar phosphate permease